MNTVQGASVGNESESNHMMYGTNMNKISRVFFVLTRFNLVFGAHISGEKLLPNQPKEEEEEEEE
jgi:hypothetical protein